MDLQQSAETAAKYLAELNQRVVFAESCTGGQICAQMVKVPGISQFLCGSYVTYRPSLKTILLGVRKRTIKKYSTESPEVAGEMALGALMSCPEADWSLSIVGHFGPDAPKDKDGQIFIAIGRRTGKGKIKIEEISNHTISGDRIARQNAATETALELLARALVRRHRKVQAKTVVE